MKPIRIIGWRLVFAAGCIPALVGSSMLVLGLWSATLGRTDPWMAPVGPQSFSAAGLERDAPGLFAAWLLTVHLCGANLAASGATISVIARFALREGKPWAWVYLWILILWVGLNDAVALLFYRYTTGAGIPFALIPLTLASIGMARHRWEEKCGDGPLVSAPPRF